MSALFRHKPTALALIIFGLMTIGRLLGIGPLDSVWSIAHWSATPIIGMLAWLVVTVLIGWLFLKYADRDVSSPTWLHWMIAPAFIAIAILFRLDSFVYGGGNLRIADFAQTPQVIIRWFEYGAVAIVAKLYHSLREMDVPTREAAVNGWMIWSLVMAAVAALGAVRLASLLSSSFVKRLLTATLIFFGGHTLVLLGYTGPEAVVPTAVIWFAVAVVRYSQQRTLMQLSLCWGIALAGLLFHVSLLMLLPGCLVVTLSHFGGKKTSQVPLTGGLVALAVIVVGLYVQAGKSLELRSVILLFQSKYPFSDYGILSPRHLIDWLQLIVLGAPIIATTGYLYFTKQTSKEVKPAILALVVTSVSGLATMLVLDPYHSVVLDTPRLLSYLAPVSVLLACLLAADANADERAGRTLGVMASVSLSSLFAILPVYHSIACADKYVLPYLTSHDTYFTGATMAFRDAHFHRKEIDSARDWEDNLAVRSTDYFLLRGSDYLRQNGNYAAAVTEQTKIVTKFPYWAEPRAMLAVNLMSLGQYSTAKPHIDTCLMLQPYEKKHLINLYSYYRDIQDWENAVKEVAAAESIFPGDPEIRTDRMLILYRVRDYVAARVMADELLAQDSLLPFPYLVRGLLEEHDKNAPRAIPFYERFLKLAPKEPEAATIQRRLDSLKAALPSR